MSETLAITIPDSFALTVDTSCINTEEVDSQEDKDFLMEKGEYILRVVAKAALEVGQQLVEIEDRFQSEGRKGLEKYFKSLGISEVQAQKWRCKYRAYVSYLNLFGCDEDSTQKFNALGDTTSQLLWNLPTEYRQAFLADIAVDEIPSEETVAEVSRRPDVKLSKTQELLQAAKIRKANADQAWEIAKEDPKVEPNTSEYRNIYTRAHRQGKLVEKYEERIQELHQEIEAEKARTAEYEKREERIKSELEKLKFDDESSRTERIKRLTNSLTISVPQVMSDLQKFFAEKEHYPEDVKAHLLEQSIYLTNYIADQLDGN